jgi:hypothetical protein
VRRSPSLTGLSNVCLSEPEDSFLGATGPCAGRSEIFGQAALMSAGNSRSVQRQHASASPRCLHKRGDEARVAGSGSPGNYHSGSRVSPQGPQ